MATDPELFDVRWWHRGPSERPSSFKPPLFISRNSSQEQHRAPVRVVKTPSNSVH